MDCVTKHVYNQASIRNDVFPYVICFISIGHLSKQEPPTLFIHVTSSVYIFHKMWFCIAKTFCDVLPFGLTQWYQQLGEKLMRPYSFWKIINFHSLTFQKFNHNISLFYLPICKDNNWTFTCLFRYSINICSDIFYLQRGADKPLTRPGRKQATATEDFEFHISYL